MRAGLFRQTGRVMALVLAAVLLWGQLALAYSYYPAGPEGTLGLRRPTISQRLVLAPDERIRNAYLQLDDQWVTPTWDEFGVVRYTPEQPLPTGEHTARLVVEVEWGEGHTYPPLISNVTFTIAVDALEELPAPGPEELRALAWVNAYRSAAGLSPLQYSRVLGAVAAGHASYLALNPQQHQRDAHSQTPGTPGFFGATVRERTRYFGYIDSSYEVVNFTDRAEAAVDGWMESLYHRIPLIKPGVRWLGYGVAGSGTGLVNVMMTGPSEDAAGVALWPHPDQTGVPTSWSGAEVPDPLALYPGAQGPVGYTISMTFGGRPERLVLQEGELTGPEGAVRVMRFDPTNDPNLSDTVALIPYEPLEPATTYTVRLTGEVTVDGEAERFDRTWSFTTSPEEPPVLLKRAVFIRSGDRTVQEVRLEGSGFATGMQVFLNGLPVRELQVRSGSELAFRLPAGYAGGAADLLVVSPGGQEAVWPQFFAGQEDLRFPSEGPALFERPVAVNGVDVGAPALIHQSGVVLLPEAVLEALGAERLPVDAIGRVYWTTAAGARTGEYTVGRVTASVDGESLLLSLPPRAQGEQIYVPAAFVKQLTGVPMQLESDRIVIGLRDIRDHWARPQILRLLTMGIVAGTGGGWFEPDATLTRAAFVKMLMGATGAELLPDETGGFADTAGHWVSAQGYIGAAVDAGVVVPAEYPEGRFEPDRAITREEMAVMVTRAMGLEEAAAARTVTPVGGRAIIAGRTFMDADRWRRPGHIAVAVEQGIITGYLEDGEVFSYRPARLATRAEAAVMVARMLGE